MSSAWTRWRWPLALAACLAAAGLYSVHARLDVNWDLKNYHFYNAYAFLNGRLGWDIAPAQLQSYYNPLLDIPFYWLVQAIPSPRIIAFVMGSTAGIAAFMLLRMLAALFPAGTHDRALWIASAFAVGVTGSMSLAVIGSTMNEWPPAMMLMVSLAVLVASIAAHDRATLLAIGVAGVVTGIAIGLKLTYAIFGIGLIAAAATTPGTTAARLRGALAMAGFLFAGFVLSYGTWGAILYDHFANPFFPHFNAIFQSPWWEPVNYLDRNYGPRTAFQALFFPLILAQDYTLASEASFSDWRLGVLFVVAILAAIKCFARRGSEGPAPAWTFLAIFVLASYLAWLKVFGIYRYLVPLEMLSGPLIVGGMLYLLPGAILRRLVVAATAVLLIAGTQEADLGRLDFRGAYFDVAVPDVAPRSLVILGYAEPMAYAIPFFRPDTRFVSPANNFLQLSQQNLLARQIREVVAQHPGAIYTMDFHGQESVNAALASYGLARDTASCLPIRSYLDSSAMRICRARRVR